AHDIGYVRGVCPGDTSDRFVIDVAGNTIMPPRGASDAFLMPYHVERSKIMVRDRFGPVSLIDEERIARAIELTRFPSRMTRITQRPMLKPAWSGPPTLSGSWPIRSTCES